MRRPPTCAGRSPKDFEKRLEGPDRRRARPAREISAGRSVVRRGAADASRHVGLVPRRRGSDAATPGVYYHERAKSTAHDHVVFHMSNGATVTLQRSAPLRLDEAGRARQARRRSRCCAALGPEPLGNAFDAAMLAQACAGKKTSLKAALLDQRVVAGLGNIYVCEALLPRAAVAEAHGLHHRRPQGRAERARGARWSMPSRRCCKTPSRPAARRCATIAAPTARSAISSTISGSTTARASRARRRAARARSNASCRTAARPSIARAAKSEPSCAT